MIGHNRTVLVTWPLSHTMLSLFSLSLFSSLSFFLFFCLMNFYFLDPQKSRLKNVRATPRLSSFRDETPAIAFLRNRFFSTPASPGSFSHPLHTLSHPLCADPGFPRPLFDIFSLISCNNLKSLVVK